MRSKLRSAALAGTLTVVATTLAGCYCDPYTGVCYSSGYYYPGAYPYGYYGYPSYGYGYGYAAPVTYAGPPVSIGVWGGGWGWRGGGWGWRGGGWGWGGGWHGGWGWRR